MEVILQTGCQAVFKQKTSWDEEKKKQVEPVFLVEYLMMSSEYENDWEDDTIYEITSLKWRSDECLIGHQKFCSEIQMFKKAKYKTYKDQQRIIQRQTRKYIK